MQILYKILSLPLTILHLISSLLFLLIGETIFIISAVLVIGVCLITMLGESLKNRNKIEEKESRSDEKQKTEISG